MFKHIPKTAELNTEGFEKELNKNVEIFNTKEQIQDAINSKRIFPSIPNDIPKGDPSLPPITPATNNSGSSTVIIPSSPSNIPTKSEGGREE
ncbi:MAG: hypothetical protein NTW25_09870 [Candidatus Kapabacteria bacterium]|nr:hypothetical protein [Candidatus Kapabacteria bacterium]